MNKLKEEDLLYWHGEQQASFDKLRKLLVENVTLTITDFEKKFILEVDVCKTGFGAVLYQKDDDLRKRRLFYASCKNHQGQSRVTQPISWICALRWAVCSLVVKW